MDCRTVGEHSNPVSAPFQRWGGKKKKLMRATWKTFAVAVFWCQAGLAQMAPPTILEIDIENFVAYFDDIPDVSKRATDPNATIPVLGRNFAPAVYMGDIVAVNGQ